jgi:hypothetical protein
MCADRCAAVRRSGKASCIGRSRMVIVALALVGAALGAAWGPLARADQTIITWANPSGGDWWTAPNWSPQIVPNEASHDALLVGTGPFTVHLNSGIGVGHVGIGPQATLSLDEGAALFNSSGDIINDGTIQVTGFTWTTKAITGNSASRIEVLQAKLNLWSSLTNDGEILVQSDPTHTPAIITHPMNWGVALMGSGRIVLSAGGDPSRAQFLCEGGYDAYWVQDVNHSVTGEGSIIGAFRNNGRVSANIPGQVLLLTDFYSGKTNSGTMEAVAGGILANGGTIAQEASGVIRADGGTVRLLNGSWITGGTLATASGSVIECQPGTVNFAHPTNSGQIDVPGGSTLAEQGGTLTNNGTIILNPNQVGDDAVFYANEYTTLAGSGQLVLRTAGDPSDARIQSLNSRMTNGAGHTICGEGRIATGLTNDGRISANVPGRVLQLDGGTNLANNGIYEAVGGGILNIYDSWIDQRGGPGVIRADGGTVHLYNGARVIGGALATTGGSAIEIASGTAYINSPTVNGEIDVLGGTTLVAETGAVTNNGTIVVNPSQGGVDAVLQATDWGCFSGTGQIILKTAGDVNDARLETLMYWRPTANGANHTIRGEGLISAIITNFGVIDADVPGRTLLITDLGENTGIVRTSGGSLQVPASITNNGTVEARNGGTGRFTSIGANYGGNNLYRGAWHVYAGSTLRLLGADVLYLNADVLLDGAGSNLCRDDGSTSALASMTNVGSGGRLEVRNGRALPVAGNLHNSGTVVVGLGGGISVPQAYTQEGDSTHGSTTVRGVLSSVQTAQIQGGVLDGDGQVDADLVNSGEIRPGFPIGHLTVTGSFHQTSSGVLDLGIAAAVAELHDQLLVTGPAQLAGTLRIMPAQGYVAHAGDSLVVMTYGGHAGVFDEIVADLGAQVVVEPIYRASELVLLVTNSPAGIGDSPQAALPPEPRLTAYLRGPGEAIFSLALPSAGEVRMSLFDLAGRQLTPLVEGVQAAGVREWRWSGRAQRGRSVPSGLYFVRAEVIEECGVRHVLRAKLPLFR